MISTEFYQKKFYLEHNCVVCGRVFYTRKKTGKRITKLKYIRKRGSKTCSPECSKKYIAMRK